MFTFGLLIGSGTMLFGIQDGPTQAFDNHWKEMIEINVVYATLLHDQKYKELKWLIETNMAAGLDGMDKLGIEDENKSSARLVRGYYDLTGSTPPSQIDQCLSGVQGTDVRRLASAMTVHSN